MRWIIITATVVAIGIGILLFVFGGGSPFIDITFSQGLPGLVEAGRSFSPPASAVLVVLILFVALTIGLWTLLRWLWTLPSRMKDGQSRRRREKAIEAMEEALIASAAGDNNKAAKQAARVRDLLPAQMLGQLMSARVAAEAGKHDDADIYFRNLLDDTRTALVARLGLAKTAQARGDMSSVIVHAGAAMDHSKSAHWPFEALFDAYMRQGQWEEAAELLARGEKRGAIDKAQHARRKAVLLSAAAAEAERQGEKDTARDLAERAVAAASNFAPAVVLLARYKAEAGETSKAEDIIEKAWSRDPHPALVSAWQDLKPDLAGAARAKHLRQLSKHKKGHKESYMVLALSELAEKSGGQALDALSSLLEDENATQRVFELAARAATLAGDHTKAREYQNRAITAPMDPDWSDLDPEGPAFRYTEGDWRRLVLSFGDDGELIHPRFEQSRRAASVAALGAPDVALAAAEPPRPDDPGTVEAVDVLDHEQVFIGNSESDTDKS